MSITPANKARWNKDSVVAALQDRRTKGLGQVKREWTTSTGPGRYRRGMYTFLWRTTPHPLLTAFDAPDGTSACTRRLRSNTPLQGLILLNDEAFVEFARAWPPGC